MARKGLFFHKMLFSDLFVWAEVYYIVWAMVFCSYLASYIRTKGEQKENKRVVLKGRQ